MTPTMNFNLWFAFGEFSPKSVSKLPASNLPPCEEILNRVNHWLQYQQLIMNTIITYTDSKYQLKIILCEASKVVTHYTFSESSV